MGPPTFPMQIGINSARRLINFQAQYELRPSPSHPHSWVALQLDASEWEVEEQEGQERVMEDQSLCTCRLCRDSV